MYYTEPDHNIGDIVLTTDASFVRNNNWEPQTGYICEKEKVWNPIGQFYQNRYKVKFFKSGSITCTHSAHDIEMMKQRAINSRG